ncbi:MAG: hypothetical protein ACK417_06605 [Bacteroidia bacterium]
MKKLVIMFVVMFATTNVLMAQSASTDSTEKRRMIIKFENGKWDTTYVDSSKPSAKDEIKEDIEEEVADAMSDFRAEMKELRKELKEVKPRKKKVDKNLFFIDIGANGFRQSDGLTLTGNNQPMRTENALNRSLGWGFTFARTENLIAQRVRLMYGLGFEFNNYRFRGDSILQSNGDLLSFGAPANPGLTRNAMSINYINAPLMLHFTTNPYKQSRAFNLAVGAEIGVRMGGVRIDQRYDMGNDVYQEVRTRGPQNAQFLKASLVARAGYGDFDLFVRYGLTEMFRQDVAGNPSVIPVMAGVSFKL